MLLGIAFLRNTIQYKWKTELWTQLYDRELNALIPVSDYADNSKSGCKFN
jgi:hypothetical protein